MGIVANILPFEMSDDALRRRIAELALDSSRIIVIDRASAQMKERRILFPQILRVLQGGSVKRSAKKTGVGDWQCTVEMLDAGDYIKVAAVLSNSSGDEAIIVVAVT